MVSQDSRVETMRCIRLRGWIFLLVAATGGVPANGQTIAWRTSYEEGLREAEASQKPVWLQFTGPWCLFCRRMDRETFSRPEVAALSRHGFIPVKIRADEREDLTQRFEVSSLPTTIVMASNGRVLLRHEGYSDASEFQAIMGAFVPKQDSGRGDAVALAGYDPVRLVEQGDLAAGSPAFAIVYDGRSYRFSDAAERDAFLKNPDRFLPCGRGNCLVSLVENKAEVAGDPRFGVFYRDHLYLCATESARAQFARDPEKYAQADVAEGGLCPHCKSVAGGKVRGKPQFSTFYQGLRYLFPDAEHRQAFRSEPEKYLR